MNEMAVGLALGYFGAFATIMVSMLWERIRSPKQYLHTQDRKLVDYEEERPDTE